MHWVALGSVLFCYFKISVAFFSIYSFTLTALCKWQINLSEAMKVFILHQQKQHIDKTWFESVKCLKSEKTPKYHWFRTDI